GIRALQDLWTKSHVQFAIESIDLHALVHQTSDQFRDCFVARLSRRNQVSDWLVRFRWLLDTAPAEFIKILQVAGAKLRRHRQHRTRRDQLHVHDVAWTP